VSQDGLPQLVRSFLDEELLLGSENGNAARANLMMFGFDHGCLDAVAVGQALGDVGRELTTRLAEVDGPVTLYAWYDEQAGQLRCSAACVVVDDLPFSGPYRQVDDPGPVLERMAADADPALVPWEELREGPGGGTEPMGEYWFPVFAVQVAGSAIGCRAERVTVASHERVGRAHSFGQ